MKITDTKPVGPVDRVTTPDPAIANPPKDRVTVHESRAAQVSVGAARSATSTGRASRLKDIEQQVRAGNFRPNPSRVAEEILQDAEIDAKLRQLISH
jgi:anti-sigma28 factor (negative regulator of flagellin synthesis)